MDRSLTFKRNMESVRSKLKSRVNIVQKLTGTTWGCSAKTLRTTTKAMILQIIGHQCGWEAHMWNSLTPKFMLHFVLLLERCIPHRFHNITPASILREQSALRECWKIRDNWNLPINKDIHAAPSTLRLKSRKPFWIFYRNFERMENQDGNGGGRNGCNESSFSEQFNSRGEGFWTAQTSLDTDVVLIWCTNGSLQIHHYRFE